MVRIVLIAVVAVALIGGSSAAQTLAEVVAACKALDGDRPERKAAAERFEAWGDDAIPHLRAIALGRAGVEGTRFLVGEALARIPTQASASLLVEILSGDGRLADPMMLLRVQEFEAEAGDEGRAWLDGDPRFKPAIVAWLDEPVRATSAIACIGRHGWADQLPALDALLEHHSLEVQRAAVGAIEAITGVAPAYERPDGTFVGERDEAVLVGPVARLEFPYFWKAPTAFGITTWFDGDERIVMQTADGLAAHDAALAQVGLLDVQGVHDAAGLRDADGRQLVVVATGAGDDTLTWTAYDASGGVVWTRTLSMPFLPYVRASTLTCRDGAQRLLVPDGAPSVVVLDARGEVEWSLAREPWDYALATHPGLPGILASGGEVLGVGADGDWVVTADLAVATLGNALVVFPDARGRPALVHTGSDGERFRLQRLDDRLEPVWTATFPDRVLAIALLEREQGDRLVVAATGTGELHVVDVDGIRRQRVVLAEDAGVTDVRALMTDDGPRLVLSTFREVQVFDVP